MTFLKSCGCQGWEAGSHPFSLAHILRQLHSSTAIPVFLASNDSWKLEAIDTKKRESQVDTHVRFCCVEDSAECWLVVALAAGATDPATTSHDRKLHAASFACRVSRRTTGACCIVTSTAGTESFCVLCRTVTVAGFLDDRGSTEIAATIGATTVSCTAATVGDGSTLQACAVTSTVSLQTACTGSGFACLAVTVPGAVAASFGCAIGFATACVACAGK
mgnify:CR=1 FL=1